MKPKALSIRVYSRGETIDVSWVRDGVPEIYNRTSSHIIRTFIDDWKNWVNVILIRSKSTNSKREIRKDIFERGIALESLLFGGLPWKSENISTFKFLVDPEWTLLPFEILPLKENVFLVENKYVVRSIRFPHPIPSGKKGDGMLLWYQKVPHLQESLDIERVDLEGIISEKKINYKIFLGRESNARAGFLSIQGTEFLHFAGHSNIDGIFVSENTTISNSEWDGLDLSNISLAFFNTCYSGLVKEGNDGLTQIVLRRGIKEFIGYSTIVPTDKAQFIGVNFWSFFFEKQNSEEAIFNVRNKYFDTYGKENIIPFLLVHYKSYSEVSQANKNTSKIFSSILLVGILGIISFFLIDLSYTIFYINDNNHSSTSVSKMVEKEINSIDSSTVEGNLRNGDKNIKSIHNLTKYPKNEDKRLPSSNQNKEQKNQKSINQPTTTLKNSRQSDNNTNDSKLVSSKNLKQDIENLNLNGLSNEFKKSIELFLNTNNPLLEENDKLKIIREILFLDEPEPTKRWIFKKKTGF